MSRIGKLPITIPANVNVDWNGSKIIVKGKFGTLETMIPKTIAIQQNEKKYFNSQFKREYTKSSSITWIISNTYKQYDYWSFATV